MSPLSDAERHAAALALRRAADRISGEAIRASRRHRGKGSVESSTAWMETHTYESVVRWLREWADRCDTRAG